MLLDDLVGDEKPKTRSFIAFGRKEDGENILQGGFVHTLAIVLDSEYDVFQIGLGKKADGVLPALGDWVVNTGFDGIFKEVYHGDLETVPIDLKFVVQGQGFEFMGHSDTVFFSLHSDQV